MNKKSPDQMCDDFVNLAKSRIEKRFAQSRGNTGNPIHISLASIQGLGQMASALQIGLKKLHGMKEEDSYSMISGKITKEILPWAENKGYGKVLIDNVLDDGKGRGR